MTLVRDDLMATFTARLKSMGIDPKAEQNALVEVVRPESVPLRGNVHIPAGRGASRKAINKAFAKLKF